MAVPSYTTDLALINAADATTGWAELTGHTGGGAAAAETDFYIQNTTCISQSTGTQTGVNTGLQYTTTALSGFTTGDCIFMWQIFLAPNAIDTWANGGMRIGVGSSAGNIRYWKSMGKDFGKYPYGGWQNTAIDPTFTPDYTEGTPVNSSYAVFASWPNLTAAVSKGNPHGVDVVRWGRGELVVTGGESGNYAIFSGISTQNDSTANRWGLFQKDGTGYLWKGLMSLGTSGTLVDFRDSNVAITIEDTPRTYTDFNRIDINNASSVVQWNSISFNTLNPTQLSRGSIYVNANASVTWDSCNFTNMNLFSLASTVTATACVFRGCNAITAAGANLSGSTVAAPTVAADTSALIWNVATDTSGKLDDMTFTKGTNAHHAIELGTSSPTTVTLNNINFTGFSTSNGQNDSVIHVKRTSGTVTINLNGVSGTVSYKSDGATVSLVNSTTLTLTGLKNPTEVRVFDAGTTTAIAGTENVTTGTFSTGIDAALYPDVDIAIISLGYQNIRLLGVDVTSDVSIPIQQTIDRQYLNP